MVTIIKTTPYMIKFGNNILNNLLNHAIQEGYNWLSPFVEDGVEEYFEIKLDYDEDSREYIMYFDSFAHREIFVLKYSECFR